MKGADGFADAAEAVGTARDDAAGADGGVIAAAGGTTSGMACTGRPARSGAETETTGGAWRPVGTG